MTIILGLVVAGLVIAGFILYWVVVLMLFALLITFAFWRILFSQLIHDQALAAICAVVATGLTVWAYSAYSEYRDNQRQSEGRGNDDGLLAKIEKENTLIVLAAFAVIAVVGFGLVYVKH